MTARELWEALLIELTKVNAPSILLSEYNYYINKAINQYVNKGYNLIDINQQSVDSLRSLKAFAELSPQFKQNMSDIYGGVYEINLPKDYFHLLNCICIYELQDNHKCLKKGDQVSFPAKRLTAEAWSVIMNDYYSRPLPERPYYYINNSLQQQDSTIVEQPRTILQTKSNKVVETIQCEIRCGNNAKYELKKVFIDYIKMPQKVELTKPQIDLVTDTSQVLEFPDYVCNEIINELVQLVMAKNADPRISVYPQVSQSIAPPTQQQ